MTTFVKNYIGKGTQINGMDIVKITLKVQDILMHKYEKEWVEYVTFEVAKLKEADKYNRTHTCYVSTKEEGSQVSEPAPKKAGKKTVKK